MTELAVSEVERDQQALRLVITGDFDAVAAPECARMLRSAVATAPAQVMVLVDLRTVRTLSAAGVHVVDAFAAENRQHERATYVLADGGSQVARVLHMTLTGDPPVYGSPAEALADYERGAHHGADDDPLRAAAGFNGGESLAHTMGELAVRLQQQADRAATLEAIVAAAVPMVPGADWAGISLVQGQQITAQAPTHELVAEVDQLQTELGEGPCLTAIREQHTVRIDDLAEPDQRWPRFAATATEWGVRSLLSFQLFVSAENLGALNLYAKQPGAFDPDAETVGGLFAQHAAVALADATHEHHLNLALANRDEIGQAKGILMARDRLTGQQAFDLLTRASQAANMKLSEVARWLIDDTEQRANTPPDDE